MEKERLFVTADVHGSLGTWMAIKALMEPTDKLVVAGDLFDTRYGNYSNADFHPRSIRHGVSSMEDRLYYVYGNCDVEGFFPGYGPDLSFTALEKKIFLHHGHQKTNPPLDADIIIQGHTHVWELEKQGEQIHLNPGSMIRPRTKTPTYAIIYPGRIDIVELKTGQPISSLAF